ncbi:acid-sensing ion channel 3 isoform X1 [Anas platyrhynchos]|uniref:acid-sensing ion channel 3 isoform X1 n=1 Tax=Anas platyrhynchos TaxID=8839 RepID=UPI003AF24B4A
MRGGGEGGGGGGGPEPLSSLRAFASSSSLHGISHIFAYGAVSLRRVLWSVFFLGSLGLLLLVCAERVAYFLTYPHVTKLDEVAAHNLTFPAITICNLNEFRFSKITRNDMYHVGELLALLNDRYEISNPQLAEPDVLAALRDKANFKNFKAKPFSMAEFYNRTGHDLADMLLQCSFRGANCTARNFTVQELRPGRLLPARRAPHPRHAAELPLPWPGLRPRELHRHLHPPGQVLHLQLGAAGHRAADHAAGRRGQRPGADAQHPAGGIPARLGGHRRDVLRGGGEGADPQPAGAPLHRPAGLRGGARLPDLRVLPAAAARARQLVYLPPPWGDCKATPIESDFFTNYSITACRLDCETRYLAENCNCRMVHMPGNANVCTPEQYKECADPALDFLVKKDSEYCACRTPCDMVRYGKELSMVKIPSKASARYLAKKFNKTEQYIADNVLVLDIFFEALNYEMIEQKKAYEVAGLLGDIGGQMGLFIGASLLTILEIFDYLYEVFRDKLLGFYKDKKRMRRSSSSTLSACHPLRSHADGVAFAPNVLPRHPALGALEEFAC